MLREMQREVNTGHPFERRLHIDYSTKNHPNQLHAANDIDCCFMVFISSNHEKLWSNVTTGQSEKLREQTDDKKGKQTEDNSRERSRKPAEGGGPAGLPRGRRRFPWWHLQIMTSANLGDSWSSKTGTSGCDQQICPGIFLSS